MVVTFSKLLALLSLILGTILSLIIKDPMPFTASLGVVTVIVAAQNAGNAYIKSKELKE